MKINAKLQEQMRHVMEERVAFNRLLGLHIESFDPKSIGAKAYRSLADEFRRRHGRA